MLLAALLLSAALVPQEAAAAQTKLQPGQPKAAQAPAAPAQQAAPSPQASQPQAPEPAAKPAPAVSPAANAEAAGPIAEGIAAFRRHRFAAARAAFEKAVEADPQSAAAAFYLGYTYYKIGEPPRRMNPNKEKAKELFAKAFSLDPTFKPTWGR
jgi:tetratricopeptide (TPR) repeat protein